jgi:hypothetical protein
MRKNKIIKHKESCNAPFSSLLSSVGPTNYDPEPTARTLPQTTVRCHQQNIVILTRTIDLSFPFIYLFIHFYCHLLVSCIFLVSVCLPNLHLISKIMILQYPIFLYFFKAIVRMVYRSSKYICG